MKRIKVDKFSKALQRLIIRDQHTCWLCHEKVRLDLDKNHFFAPTIDHVVEKRNAGWDSQDNFKLAHKFCNNIRSKYPNPKKHPKYASILALWRKPTKQEKVAKKNEKA